MNYDLVLDIYKYGTYYNPAKKRYGNHCDDEIGCDRCNKIPLLSCISWREYDICMECIHEIEDSLYDEVIVISDDE